MQTYVKGGFISTWERLGQSIEIEWELMALSGNYPSKAVFEESKDITTNCRKILENIGLTMDLVSSSECLPILLRVSPARQPAKRPEEQNTESKK
ncbi:hypothetical protein GCM10017711_20850 [Paeniglutamicibacter sulfureus]